jgi:hypothetical protein
LFVCVCVCVVRELSAKRVSLTTYSLASHQTLSAKRGSLTTYSLAPTPDTLCQKSLSHYIQLLLFLLNLSSDRKQAPYESTQTTEVIKLKQQDLQTEPPNIYIHTK